VSTGPAGWAHARLTLVQPGWPGVKKASWVALTAAGEQFRCADVLDGLDRLGAAGWELVAFAPEQGDRATCFYFKTRIGAGSAAD
jgi:hypothetical protein